MSVTVPSAPAQPAPGNSATAHFIQNEKLINEEFKIWKKSVPFLYDTIQTFVTESPSLTIDVLPQSQPAKEDELEVRFLSSTYFSKPGSENYLNLSSVKVSPNLSATAAKQHLQVPEVNSKINPSFKTLQRWVHPSEVNKARFLSKFNRVVTFTTTGALKLWDLSSKTATGTLQFHEKEGFALEYSSTSGDYLLSGGEDCKIALWDLNKVGAPARTFSHHKSIVNDFSWNAEVASLFGSVSDDATAQFSDLRADSVVLSVQGDDIINSIDFNPKVSSLFVLGSADNLISVYDLRNTDTPVRQLYGHNNAVSQVSFNKLNSNLLASSSNDRRICVWDLANISEDFSADDFIKNDVDDPCLAFVHGGHTAKITEFQWCQDLVNTIISAGEDNLIQVWKPHLATDNDEDDEDDDEHVKDEA